MMSRMGWTAVGAIAGVAGVVVAILAWLLPTAPGSEPASPGASITTGVAVRASPTPAPPSAPEGDSAPTVAYLADLEATRDSDPYDDRGVAEISGSSYPHSQGAKFCASQYERRWTYVLGRKYDRFKGVVGLSDDSVAAAKIRFEISIDGRPAFSEELRVGDSAPIDISVKDALRIELVTTLLTKEGRCGSLATGQWADARVEGSP